MIDNDTDIGCIDMCNWCEIFLAEIHLAGNLILSKTEFVMNYMF